MFGNPSDRSAGFGTDPARLVADRALRLATGVSAPFNAMLRPWIWAVVGSAALGVAVAIRFGQPLAAIVTTIGAALLVAVVLFRSVRERPFRRALELFFDHTCHERWEWQQETGTSLPRTPRAMRKWLDAHPTGPGRASILLTVGELDAADVAIDQIRPATAEELFAVDILRAHRALYGGSIPDVATLRAAWPGLPDERERRHQRECLGLLEAMIAVDRGEDPVRVLAAARDDFPDVHASMRARALLARWIAVPTLISTVVVAGFAAIWAGDITLG